MPQRVREIVIVDGEEDDEQQPVPHNSANEANKDRLYTKINALGVLFETVDPHNNNIKSKRHICPMCYPKTLEIPDREQDVSRDKHPLKPFSDSDGTFAPKQESGVSSAFVYHVKTRHKDVLENKDELSFFQQQATLRQPKHGNKKQTTIEQHLSKYYHGHRNGANHHRLRFGVRSVPFCV